MIRLGVFLKGRSTQRHRQAMGSKPISLPKKSSHVVQAFNFKNEDSLKDWEEKIFKNKSEYHVIQEEGQTFLRAKSQDASSGLFKKVNYDLTPGLYLAWQWRVTTFPVKPKPAELSNRSQDDFAARIYVVFPGSSFFNTRVIEYLWDKDIEEGVFQSSPYSGKVKLFVAESGIAKSKDGWMAEERNLFNDYVEIFGQKPDKPIGAIAFMSDSDNTHTSSSADFKNIAFKRKDQTGSSSL